MNDKLKPVVLVVDDEEPMRQLLSNILKSNGFEPVTAENGEEAVIYAVEHSPDFIILDIMMPVMDGYEACKKIRERSDVPVLMLTAKAEEIDKVTALKIGADDYLVKPFGKNELVARIEAILRRTSHTPESASMPQTEWTYENIVLNTESKRVKVDGSPVSLTKKEFEVLELLIQHPEQVFSREQLLDKIWGFEYLNASSRTVDTHVKTLRLKLKNAAPYIKTVWGMGYKLEASE